MTLRPDTKFVLHFNAFTHKAQSGYACDVWDGRVIARGKMLSGEAALSFLAAHPDTVVSVLHV